MGKKAGGCLELELMRRSFNVDAMYSLCVGAAGWRFLKLKVRRNGGREMVWLTVSEKSSFERLTRRCSKSSLSRRRDDLFLHTTRKATSNSASTNPTQSSPPLRLSFFGVHSGDIMVADSQKL